MKIKITRTDGTVIEAEGTAAECIEFAQMMAPQAAAPAEAPPITWPAPGQQVFPWIDPFVPTWIPETAPNVPWWPEVIGPYVPPTTYPGTTPYPYTHPYPFTVPSTPFIGITTGSIRIGSSVQLSDNLGGSMAGVSLTNVSLGDITSSLFS